MKPPTPVLDKRKAVLADSQKLGEFLDWLSGQGIFLAHYRRPEGWIDEVAMPIGESTSDVLHRYFGIDPVAEENEKRALLDYIRSQQ